jgi:tellurite resistance protein
MAMNCIEQLDAYSRHLGRNPQARESAAALALLPETLFRTHTVVADLRSWLDSTLEDSFALADYRILLDKCSVTASDKAITKKDLTLLAQFLERLHVGIEPDPRFGPALPEPDGKVVLFRLGQDQPTTATTGYSAATMLLTLGAAVATADEEVTAEEKERLERQIRTFDLPAADSLRLRAQAHWLLNGGVRFSFVAKLFEVAPVDDSQAVAEFLLDVARADGEINAAEIDILSKVYRLLRLDPKTLFSAAHKVATESPLRQTPDGSRNVIPKAHQASAQSRVAIDMDKVATKNAESERVSVLLREIFVQDEHPSPAERIAQEHSLGLHSSQATFPVELLKRPCWSRADLERLAAGCQTLLEGTLDAINDAALDNYNDLLLEGDDPIHLNPTIAKELSNEHH